MELAPSEILEKGLSLFRLELRAKKWSEDYKNTVFHKHFGSSPIVVASIWADLLPTVVATDGENMAKELKGFLTAMHFLWAAPKNSAILASAVDCCERLARGEPVWKWVRRIQQLKDNKIEALGDVDEIYAVSADGIDFKLWERKHHRYNIDPAACSHKFKACAAKYLIALSIQSAKCVLVSGPYPGGMSDLDMMRASGLQELLSEKEKIAMLDRGFRSKDPNESKFHAYPDEIDDPELHKFKSRCRLRQETFNRRLRHFTILLNTFVYGFDKHKIAFEAVVVIVQYQMDLGSPIFAP